VYAPRCSKVVSRKGVYHKGSSVVQIEVTLTLEDLESLGVGVSVVKSIRGGFLRLVPDLDMEKEKLERLTEEE
jgi:hypothetical protein